jgi:acid phosphatase type 7
MQANRHYGLAPVRAADQVQHEILPRENEPGFVGFPTPPGQPPYRMPLADLGVGDPTDLLAFHAIGDHGGIVDAIPQEAVAAALVADIANDTAGGYSRALFLYSIGDLVYFNGDAAQWLPQFYEPYERYPGPIVGIPGNHDGDNSDDPDVPSLDAFYRNMCAPAPALTPEAGDVDRDAMTQPGPYWTLTAELATIVGLYTNVPSGGVVQADQAMWLTGELKAAPTDRALILALHHPPYSCDAHHGGSAAMGSLIDGCCNAAGRWPDLVLAGHVHDYQRFTRDATADHASIAYIVNGAGGYHNLHEMAPDLGALPYEVPGSDVTLEAYCDTAWGFLRLGVTPHQIMGEYTAVQRTGQSSIVDRFAIPIG